MFYRILTLLLFSALCLRGAALSLDDLMTSDEQSAIGASKLSDTERAALETWISRWTQICIDQAPLYHPGDSLKEWVLKLPLAVQPVQQASPEEIAAQQKEINQKIFRVREDGSIIDLLDGSTWKIADYETYKTRKWQRGDVMVVEKSARFVTYPPYRLKNMTRRQFADASMIQPSAPTGQRSETEQSYYEGATRVTEVQNKGEFVFLADGTSWQICPVDQVRSRKWKVGDRIRLGATRDMLYPNSLENLDSGEQVKGNSKEKR
jgi:hypothetical protein